MRRFFFWVGLLTWVVVGTLLFTGKIDLGKMAEEGAQIRQANAAAEAAAEKECRSSAACMGDKLIVAAGVKCRRPIEELAKYDVRWTDGVLEPKFSRYRWKDVEAGILTFIGDKVQFQNGFGAWQRATYECDLDVAAKEPVDVRVILAN